MRKMPWIVAVAFLLIPYASARADHYSDTYIVPAAAHTSGANSTFFVTDVAIQNFQSSPLTVLIDFIENGEGNLENVFPLINPAAGLGTGSINVPPAGNVLIKDILNGFQGRSDRILGALLIFSDRPFALTTRTYNNSPSGGTVGVGIPPTQDFFTESVGQTDLTMAVAYIPGLISNAQYRTNIGFVASSLGETPLLIEVTLNNETASILNARKVFSIPPGSIVQLQFSSRDIANANFNSGSATLRILGGSGAVIPFATVVDNVSADAVYVSGVFPPNTQPSSIFNRSSSLRLIFGRNSR